MKLSALLPIEGKSSFRDKEIKSIENDSRQSGSGTLFIAYSSYVKDSHIYIDSAYSNGCRDFVVSDDRVSEFQERYPDAQWFGSADLPLTLAQISSRFYGNPSLAFRLIGITGTNGKTTTAMAVYQNLTERGFLAGLIGTIDYRIGTEVFPTGNTTPDVLELNRILRKMADKGVKIVVMEVSSHALALGRVLGLHFDIAAFTNLTQDHLDFHQTMRAYLEAKMKLLSLLARSEKSSPIFVLNRDMDFYEEVLQEAMRQKLDFRTYSLRQEADYVSRIKSISPSLTSFEWNGFFIQTQMIGLPNVANISLAAAILDLLGQNPEEFLPIFEKLHVKGRMERVNIPQAFHVLIDYAHTPDALRNVLKTLSDVKEKGKRLFCVFGAGGDRDKSKRPLMAKAVSEFADFMVLTSDNPRTEDPDAIIRDVLEGLKDTRVSYEVEPDRKRAIEKALERARKGDIVLIAGKGHEDYQIIGKTKHHFSDREVVEQWGVSYE